MRTLRLVGLIFALFGALFTIVGGGLVYYQDRAYAGLREAVGQVVANERGRGSSMDDDGYRAVVRFETADGRQVEIQSRVRSNPPAFDVGERVTVRYDPAVPDNARIDSFMERWFGPLIFGGLGSVFLLLGLGMVGWLSLRRRRDAQLKATGERYAARVLGVVRNASVQFNDQAAWRVHAEWTDGVTGERRVALSRNLDFDPSPWLKSDATVFVDRKDRNRTLLDISDIEAAASA